MVRIATSAVAVSIAVMVITLAVVFGFKKEIYSTLSDLSSDISVTDISTLYGAEVREVKRDSSLNLVFSMTKGIKSIDGYAMRSSVIRSKSGASGIVIKGIASFDPNSALARTITAGTTPRIEENRYKELLLPEKIASELNVGVGDRVELLSLEGPSLSGKDIFKVCGIYSSLGEMPITVALTDIRNVQKLNGWSSDTFSGFEIDVEEGYSVEQVTEQLNWNIFDYYVGYGNLSAVAASELYANIFAWLQTHDVNAVVIIVIMFIVVLFNMITALLILLFERTRMVGILKSLGMSNRSIRQIFLYQAAKIVGKGLAIGNTIAIVLIIIQKYTGVIKLDASAYFVSQVPVSISVVEILIINTIFAAAILSLLFAATAIVARIEPAESVKYE
ncbi:MAG: ABC transporter permease [Alistipes sp.]|nr:ABC transporter permease [Alistipes sp.]